MNTKIIVITGPAGAGKSTVGEKLAKTMGNCVNIDADHIKHMIVSGFYKDSSPGGWGFIEWKLVAQSICLLAKNFQKNDYNVIINGYLDESAWTIIDDEIRITHKFVLLPDLNIVKSRDIKRSGDQPMGASVVELHYWHFSESDFYQSFTFIDSTNEDAETTCERLLNMTTQHSS